MPRFRTRSYRGLIYAVCSHKSKVFKVSTGIGIPDQFWDFETHQPKKTCPNREETVRAINLAMKKLMRNVNQLQMEGREPFPEAIREFYKDTTKEEAISFLKYFEQYIELKRSRVAEGTYNNLRLARGSLERFAKAMHLRLTERSFDKVMFEKYIAYQININRHSDYTINKHVKKIREFMQWAYPTLPINFIKYSPPSGEEPIFLTEGELRIVKESDPPSSPLLKARDLFLFCCVTGMRYSDSQRFRKEWIYDGIITYRMQKTGGKAYVPLRDTALAILDRWNGNLPKMPLQNCNDYLKTLFSILSLNREVTKYRYFGGRLHQEILPLNEVVTTHLARKTFITQSLLNGIAIQDVMKMSGHSDYKSMKPYIAISNGHLKEVAKRWEI